MTTQGQDEINLGILRVLEDFKRIALTDGAMQRALAEGFRSLALQGDRYDTEIRDLREEVSALKSVVHHLEAIIVGERDTPTSLDAHRAS